MIHLFNVFVIVASGLCLIDNIYVIVVGRFIYGMASGAFTVFVPKFINETAPTELKGPFGTLTQFMCTLGILVAALFALAIPNPDAFPLDKADADFYITGYWRVMWGFPIIMAVIQSGLMLVVFRYDTPLALKQRQDWDNLAALMSKIYKHE